jgi:hypothetical protein
LSLLHSSNIERSIAPLLKEAHCSIIPIDLIVAFFFVDLELEKLKTVNQFPGAPS